MFHLNEKQYIRFQTMFLCAFLFCFLMAGFHTGMWHEVFAAAVPEKTAASETETASGGNALKGQMTDSGENTVDVFLDRKTTV